MITKRDRTRGGILVQALVGLLLGLLITAGVLVFGERFAPERPGSRATSSSPRPTPTPTWTEEPTPFEPTATDTPEPSPTPTETETETPVATDTQAPLVPESQAMALLPPNPLEGVVAPPKPPAGAGPPQPVSPPEAEAPGVVQETAPPGVVPPAPEAPVAIPESETVSAPPTAPETEAVSVPPPASEPVIQPIETAPTPTPDLAPLAAKAMERANAAQDYADSQQASRYSPVQYQEGQRVYGLAMEAMRNERHRAALERFRESASAFLDSASMSVRMRSTEELRAKAFAKVLEARNLASRRQYQQADVLYQQYLREAPSDAQISLEYAEMLMDRLSFARGYQQLRKTLELPGLLPVQRARIHARFADAYHRSGDLEGAIREVSLSLQHDPENPNYANQLNQYRMELAQRRRPSGQQVTRPAPRPRPGVIEDLTGMLLERIAP
ncbi:MAG: hypothetical protein HUU16_02865 [Candidatus Omnitrophica bacterium]|nr:hypothetical protein [Candidatus Omnitrophota bacterium]